MYKATASLQLKSNRPATVEKLQNQVVKTILYINLEEDLDSSDCNFNLSLIFFSSLSLSLFFSLSGWYVALNSLIEGWEIGSKDGVFQDE